MTVSIAAVRERLHSLRCEVATQAAAGLDGPPDAPPVIQRSRENLFAYLALRQHDLESLQMDLADLGLSSLGRVEPAVLWSLDQVLARLGSPMAPSPGQIDRHDAAGLLSERAAALLGRPRPERGTRIMVTVDSDMARRNELLERLLLAGMDVLRINTAHETQDDWREIVERLRAAEQALDSAGIPPPRACRVAFDLGGPHLRTVGIPDDLKIHVSAGDHLVLLRSPDGISSSPSESSPAAIAVSHPGALDAVHASHRIAINDGKITGVVEEVRPESMLVRITGPEKPGRIRAEKGLNFPDSVIDLPALTEEDRDHLPFIVRHATAIGLSFVHGPGDVQALHKALVELGHPSLGIIAKIETRAAIHNLARILLAGLDLPAFGVMVARGDLAVEVGFEDLAFVSEDILAMCDAAHVPAIWATQVLETLTRSGLPARAEITDAVHGQRTECVMLNKGAHVVRASSILAGLLAADARRHNKKREVFRAFTRQEGVFPEGDPV
ncbi:MAG: pyruvate kinase [Dehalococcoidia bacterium]